MTATPSVTRLSLPSAMLIFYTPASLF